MKITVTKIKRELAKNYGWENLDVDSVNTTFLFNELIKDTLKIVDEVLKSNKGISILK